MKKSDINNSPKVISTHDNDFEVFVRCTCGAEMISIYKDMLEGIDEVPEYGIIPYCWYNKRHCSSPDLVFYDKSEFSKFVEMLQTFVNTKESSDPTGPIEILDNQYFVNKYYYRHRKPDVLVVWYDDITFSINKIKPKKVIRNLKHAAWEVLLDKEQAKKLLEIIKEW